MLAVAGECECITNIGNLSAQKSVVTQNFQAPGTKTEEGQRGEAGPQK